MTGKGTMDESILVCVYYGPNGAKLIRRGCKIASRLDCPLYIVSIDPAPADNLDHEKSQYIESWKKLAEEYGATEFILKDNEKRPVVKVIGEVAREKGVTQIIIGQTAKSRWEEITKGSFVNILLKELPFIDLHIISVSRELKDHDGDYEKGCHAYLVRDGDQYKISFNHTNDAQYEGIFFKETGTDFNNGTFKFMKDGEMLEIHVTEDYVTERKKLEV